MINFSNLMTISEAAQGYRGTPVAIVDQHPEMSLDECVHGFSMSLLESQVEGYESMNSQNELLIEATVNAIQLGQNPDFDSLVEGAFDNLKKKVVAFFERIKKWLQSIIAKLKVQIDKHRMSGSQLWSKYKDSKQMLGTFEGATVDGFMFNMTNIGKFITDDSEATIDKMIAAAADSKVMLPGDFAKTIGPNKDTGKINTQCEKDLKKLTDTDKSSRIFNVVKELTGGLAKTKDGWKNEVHQALYGEKKTISYGQGDFTKAKVGELLEKDLTIELGNIAQEYQRLLDTMSKKEEEFKSGLADVEATGVKELENVPDDDKEARKKAEQHNNLVTKDNNARSLVINYYNAYINALTDVVSGINTVKDIRRKFYEDRFQQATTMLGKMLTYKSKKDNADSADSYELDVIDFEL